MAVGQRAALARARTEHGLERMIQLLYGWIYGDVDLHTHIRWRAIAPHVQRADRTVDVACGDGTITLEIAQAFPAMNIRGIDLDDQAIAVAANRRQMLNATNVEFDVADVVELNLEAVDQALLLDVLEHVEDDVGLLANVASAVKEGGRLVVSVPTPNYPKFFGREFHLGVGHVRDGYALSEISELVEDAGFRIETRQHYTKLPASVACAPFYRSLWKRGRLGIALSPLLNAVSFLDYIWPWSRFASSAIVVGIKDRDADSADLAGAETN